MMDDHAPGAVLMATQDMAKNGTFDASDRQERPPKRKCSFIRSQWTCHNENEWPVTKNVGGEKRGENGGGTNSSLKLRQIK